MPEITEIVRIAEEPPDAFGAMWAASAQWVIGIRCWRRSRAKAIAWVVSEPLRHETALVRPNGCLNLRRSGIFTAIRMESTAMPVRHYVGEFQLKDNGDRTSTVVWYAEFEVASGDAAGTVEAIRNFLRSGLEHLGHVHGGVAQSPPPVAHR
jgi:hypothetical protein